MFLGSKYGNIDISPFCIKRKAATNRANKCYKKIMLQLKEIITAFCKHHILPPIQFISDLYTDKNKAKAWFGLKCNIYLEKKKDYTNIALAMVEFEAVDIIFDTKKKIANITNLLDNNNNNNNNNIDSMDIDGNDDNNNNNNDYYYSNGKKYAINDLRIIHFVDDDGNDSVIVIQKKTGKNILSKLETILKYYGYKNDCVKFLKSFATIDSASNGLNALNRSKVLIVFIFVFCCSVCWCFGVCLQILRPKRCSSHRWTTTTNVSFDIVKKQRDAVKQMDDDIAAIVGAVNRSSFKSSCDPSLKGFCKSR